MSTRPDRDSPPSAAAWSTGAPPQDGPLGPARYARGGEIGRGGMGVVEAALDTWLDRDVAIKRPRGDHLARLTREARLTAVLVHPAIPPIYDVGEDERGAWYSMPVLAGRPLDEWLAAGATLRAAVSAVTTAARAAGYAHARGIVHRDLKPANLLIGAHGEVWVLDWGVALDPKSPDTVAVGTPGYSAPEVAAGAVVTPAADVFGLGRTLSAALEREPKPPRELLAVVERATAADPLTRYANGTALADELQRWLDGQMVQAHAYPTSEVLWHVARRWRAPLTVAGVAVVAGLGLAAVALRAQQLERRRADHSLSTALAQQASAARARGARPEAEVLAAHSLALAENPLARAVLMSWGLAPGPALRERAPLPCAAPFVEPDGASICAGETVEVRGADGQLRWSAEAPALDDGWVGEVVDARIDGETVLLRRSSNHVEVWRGSERVAVFQLAGAVGLAEGTRPAIFDQHRVGLVDPLTGAVAWGPPTCERIEAALVRDDQVLIGCRDEALFVGPFEAPGAPIAVAGHPSALAWRDGPLVGTFEGDLLAERDGAWTALDAGVGAIRRVLPIGAATVVAGEHGDTRIWSPADALVGSLPRGAWAVAADGADLLAYGADVRRYALPQDLRPVAFHRDEGGISSFDASPTGAVLVAGSATGEIVSWDLATGAARREVAPGAAAAKAVCMLDEGAFVASVDALPGADVIQRQIGIDASTPVTDAARRDAIVYDGGLALLPWASHVDLVDAGGLRAVPLPARPVAATRFGGLWVADERGGVHELVGEAFARRFDLEGPANALAACDDVLILAEGPAIVARDRNGAERWRHDVGAVITAIDADAAWIAAGDIDGRVLVLRPDGALVARIAGHGRRVSGVEIRGDALFSAGWDGAVFAWGLAGLDRSAASELDRVTTQWGLSLDEALAGADPLGAGR